MSFIVVFPGGYLDDGDGLQIGRNYTPLKGYSAALARFLAPFGRIPYIDFAFSSATDCDFRDLAPLKEVKKIFCRNAVHVTDRTCRVLEQFQDLQVLEMRASQITDKGLARLGKLGRLEELQLGENEELDWKPIFKGTGFAEWPVDHPLQSLDVRSSALNLDGLNALSRLSNLKILDVSDCETLAYEEMLTVPVFPALEEVWGAVFGKEFYAAQPKLKGKN
ncbi:MAG: hypothetical protein U0941_16710 [Planctomycetaceae bacterium]